MNKIKFFKTKKLGFSLVELLVVIAIIGISSGIVLKGFDSNQKVETELEIEGLKLSAIINAQKNDALSGKRVEGAVSGCDYAITVDADRSGYSMGTCNPGTQTLKSGITFTAIETVSFKSPFAKVYSGSDEIGPGQTREQVDFVLQKTVSGVTKSKTISVFGNGLVDETAAVVVTSSVTCDSWTYTPTQACQSDGTQTVSASDPQPAGCTGGTPNTTQSCTYVPPVTTCTSWTYTPTQACQSDGTQTVSASDPQPAGCTGGTPNTTQSCTAPTCSDGSQNGTETGIDCGGTCTVARDGVTYGTVLAEDGRCWLSTNLGVNVSQLPNITSYNDTDGYGWLFQWGRNADGHQIPTSVTTSTALAPGVNDPGHSMFILDYRSIMNWRYTSNVGLWQGVAGINNPCPAGFRLPTQAEWNAVKVAANMKGFITAFNTSLKLTDDGYRINSGIVYRGGQGLYWSSTAAVNSIITMEIFSSTAGTRNVLGAVTGKAVRCIKD
ncbi:MAG: hypothetical protein ACD_8C00115G0002 [uncultured bacterium]|nr:MAG: hypothetical protein ACD_8C00115G0002 [uncultured bacterium]